MQDLSTAMPHEIQAAIAACRDPGELDLIAERAMAKWPDLAKAARRRSAAFKAHASRAGGAVRLPRPRPVAAVQVASTMTEGSVPFNVFIVSASGISEMQLATRGMALSFAERIAAQLAASVQATISPKPAKRTKLVTSCSVEPPGNWLCGQRTAALAKLALAEWAAMSPERQQHHLAVYAASREGRPWPDRPEALVKAERAEAARRNAERAASAAAWKAFEYEQRGEGIFWPDYKMREQAVLAQPRGTYSSNSAANEKLSARVARWMLAARRVAAACTSNEQKVAFGLRMAALQARRKSTTTKKEA